MARCRVIALLAVLCLAAAARAEPPIPADKLNNTKTATAFEGAALYPQMSILMGVIRGDDYMTSYLKKPDLVITAFPSTNAATKSFLSSVSKYAGVALQNETFTRGVFGHMIVPGKAWTAAELAKAAPLNLKTLHGDLLRVTKSPEAPYGVLIDGSPIALANQAAADGKVVLHLVEGNLFPDDSLQQVAAWRTASHPTAAMKLQEAAPAAKDAPAAAVASGSAGAGAGARVGAGAAAGAAALLALLL